jgi:hypothetical protein
VAIRIATRIGSKSKFNISQGFLIEGTQLLIISAIATPLYNASGVRLVISSIAVIGYIGNSPFSGNSITPSA